MECVVEAYEGRKSIDNVGSKGENAINVFMKKRS